MIERSLCGDVRSARLAGPSTPAMGVGCDQKEARTALGETRTVPLTSGALLLRNGRPARAGPKRTRGDRLPWEGKLTAWRGISLKPNVCAVAYVARRSDAVVRDHPIEYAGTRPNGLNTILAVGKKRAPLVFDNEQTARVNRNKLNTKEQPGVQWLPVAMHNGGEQRVSYMTVRQRNGPSVR